MQIASFAHKGLKQLYLKDQRRGIPAGCLEKLRRMLSFLEQIQAVDEIVNVPVWRAHPLKGDREGIWALHVTANWRLTFRPEEETNEIHDLNLEDYH